MKLKKIKTFLANFFHKDAKEVGRLYMQYKGVNIKEEDDEFVIRIKKDLFRQLTKEKEDNND